MKTSIVFGALILMISCTTLQEAPPPAAPSLPVLEIKSASTTTFQEYPALIEGKSNVDIRPQVGGILQNVFVDEGAYVSQGQPLFKINEQPFREQLNSAIANMQAAEAAVINAQLEIDKLTPLVQNKVIADYQLKAANANFSAAKAHVALAKANVGSAQINLGYTLIKAPVSGYLGRLPKKQGSLVSPADPLALASLSDIHEVHVYFSLGETDFINFKEHYAGKTLEEKLRSLPPVSLVLADNSEHTQTGKIDMVDGQFDRNTGAITLRATFPNSDGLIRSGNTGKVRLGLFHDASILVPQVATVEVQDKVFVYAVVDSNKVTKRPISIIGKSGADYLIKDGLKAGDRIVASGLDHLQEGMVIIPEKEKPAVVASKN